MSRYWRVIGAPHMLRLIVFATIGRLPIGMTALAIILLVSEETGSYLSAGFVSACLVTAAFTLPIFGRLVDRHGQTIVLIPCAIAFSASMIALALSVSAGAHIALLAILAAVAGATFPPLFASLRTLMRALLEESGLLEAAYALDAGIQELILVVGPLLVAGAVAFGSAALAVWFIAVSTLVGTIAFASSRVSRHWVSDARQHDRAGGVLRSRGVQTLLIIGAIDGFLIGSLEVILPAFAAREGSAGAAGFLLATLSVGGIVGALTVGVLGARWGASARLLTLTMLIPLAVLPMATIQALGQMGVLAFVVGFLLAPTAAASASLMSQIAPTGTITEAFTWLSSAIIATGAIGNMAAGALVEQGGISTAAIVTALVLALIAVSAVFRRGTLADGVTPP